MRLHGQIKQKPKSFTLVFLLNRSSVESTRSAKRGVSGPKTEQRQTAFDIKRMKNLLKFHPPTQISKGVKDNFIYCNLNPLYLSTGPGKSASDTPKIF